ncbi:MAG: DUF3667 domain-containing protein [Bacteroidales bacterium]|nr:DUF3667 domain-containing protein [Bacteroidales bacterium]
MKLRLDTITKRRPALRRLFRIWMVTGSIPFQKKENLQPIECPSCGRVFDTAYCPDCGQKRSSSVSSKKFFKGSFDSIPFMNDDAKRTFVHLLLRPGYMIRDYLQGKNSSYLSPMTALIIFYAFFAMVASIASPEARNAHRFKEYGSFRDSLQNASINITIEGKEKADTAYAQETVEEIVEKSVEKDYAVNAIGAATTLLDAYMLLHLDTNPEYVDTEFKASVAALESALRNGGITLFLGNLILLSLAIWWAFRKKYGISYSASAAISAYILCQYCFYMLFALALTFGKSTKIGMLLMAMLMIFDFCQLFGINRRESLRKTVHVGLAILSFWCILFAILMTVILVITFI